MASIGTTTTSPSIISTKKVNLKNDAGFKLSLLPSDSMVSNINFSYPPNVGTSGDVLTTDGLGNSSWSSLSSLSLNSVVYLKGLFSFDFSQKVGSSSVLSSYNPFSYFDMTGTDIILTLPLGGVYLLSFTSAIEDNAVNSVFFEVHNSDTDSLIYKTTNYFYSSPLSSNTLFGRWIFDQRLIQTTYNFQYYCLIGSGSSILEGILSIIRIQ
jgi:hypothetical protein